MALTKIRIYNVVITGNLIIDAPDDATALKSAQAEVTGNISMLNFALTSTDGYHYAAQAPTPIPVAQAETP